MTEGKRAVGEAGAPKEPVAVGTLAVVAGEPVVAGTPAAAAPDGSLGGIGSPVETEGPELAPARSISDVAAPARTPAPMPRLIAIAAVLTLVALALMAWSMLQPTWMPVMLAMSVGQAIGTSAFAIYLFVIVRDLRRSLRAAREAAP